MIAQDFACLVGWFWFVFFGGFVYLFGFWFVWFCLFGFFLYIYPEKDGQVEIKRGDF